MMQHSQSPCKIRDNSKPDKDTLSNVTSIVFMIMQDSKKTLKSVIIVHSFTS